MSGFSAYSYSADFQNSAMRQASAEGPSGLGDLDALLGTGTTSSGGGPGQNEAPRRDLSCFSSFDNLIGGRGNFYFQYGMNTHTHNLARTHACLHTPAYTRTILLHTNAFNTEFINSTHNSHARMYTHTHNRIHAQPSYTHTTGA